MARVFHGSNNRNSAQVSFQLLLPFEALSAVELDELREDLREDGTRAAVLTDDIDRLDRSERAVPAVLLTKPRLLPGVNPAIVRKANPSITPPAVSAPLPEAHPLGLAEIILNVSGRATGFCPPAVAPVGGH